MQETKSTCCYCGVGCGVLIGSEGGRITGVRGDPDHPANFGRLCSKGATLHLSAGLEARALHPELRTSRERPRRRVGWDAALAHAAGRFADIIRAHGPDSVAFYLSGQLLTEDYYVFNKLARGLIGTNNIDTNSRLCMSSAATGYKLSLGADAPPACYEDIDHAGCLFIAGSNTAYAHPVLFRRIEAARARNPDLRIVAVDPRRTDTTQCADLHLAIQPGTDVALFHGLLNVLLWEGLCDMAYVYAHTEGFGVLRETVREYTPQRVAGLCGIREADILQAARWFARGPTLSLYCQGLNQSTSGVDKNVALINLHLATGQIGQPGAGPLSLTGQPNAMGGREVGGMANLFSAHRDLANPEHRAEIARLWGVDSVPDQPGRTAVEMFEAVRRGEIRALWIACTNPAQSMPDLNAVHEALRRVEFLVVQDAFRDTETTRFADLLLPATTWGEKQGTVTNSERRISRVRAAVPPPGEARHDWVIAVDFACRLGARLVNGRDAARLFPYAEAESIFDEHRATTVGRDLDIGGLSYAILETRGPQQWPFPAGARTGLQRLYADGVFATPGGRAQFANVVHRPLAESASARYPLHLNTGRLRDQWHGMSRTGTVAQLCNHEEEPWLTLHPDDMARRQLADGDFVRVQSRRGGLVLRVRGANEMQPTHVFLPMHWGGCHMSGAGANVLIAGDCDPLSWQPELKHAAVRVERLDLPWRLALRALLGRFDYASCGLAGREEGVVVLRAAHAWAPAAELLGGIDRILGLDVENAITYRDVRRNVDKRVLLEHGRLAGVRLAGETVAAAWLQQHLVDGEAAEEIRRWALAPLAAPPGGQGGRGRIVCTCQDVAEQEIRAALRQGADLALLQARLRCGTECGSCVPELRRLLAA